MKPGVHYRFHKSPPLTRVTTQSTSFHRAWEWKLGTWPTVLPWRHRQSFLRNVSACIALLPPFSFSFVLFALHPNFSCILFPFCFCISLVIYFLIYFTQSFPPSFVPFLLIPFLQLQAPPTHHTRVSQYNRLSDLSPQFLALPCQDPTVLVLIFWSLEIWDTAWKYFCIWCYTGIVKELCFIYAVQQDTQSVSMSEFYSSRMLARHVSDLTGPSSGAFCTSCICRFGMW